MLPANTPQNDWSLYFHDTYMRHTSLGPVHIMISQDLNNGEPIFIAHKVTKESGISPSEKKVDGADLRIFWPRPGAYNMQLSPGALFIGRQAQRHMKRSAYRDHYFVMWNDMNFNRDYIQHGSQLSFILPMIVNPKRYNTIKQFREKRDSDCISMALSSKIILHQPTKTGPVSLIYMSEEVGVLDPDNKFITHIHLDSRTKRIIEHLKTLGVYTP